MLLNEIICVYVDLVYIFNERVTIVLLEQSMGNNPTVAHWAQMALNLKLTL
jgi:hypothetical protein